MSSLSTLLSPTEILLLLLFLIYLHIYIHIPKPLSVNQSSAMNNLNSLLNNHQISSLQEMHNHIQPPHLSSSAYFDPTSSNDDFLEQILSTVPSSASAFPWADDQSPPMLGHLPDQSGAALAAKMRQHQISNAAAKALMLQQQLFSRNLAAGGGLRSPTGDDSGLLPMPQGEHNDVVDGHSFKSADPVSLLLFFIYLLLLFFFLFIKSPESIGKLKTILMNKFW